MTTLPFAPPGATVRALYRTGHSTDEIAGMFGLPEATIWNIMRRTTAMTPFCRYCGDLIPKRTVTHSFGCHADRRHDFAVEHRSRPKDRAEAQRIVGNVHVVSVRYATTDAGRRVTQVGTWDGESYVDRFFCKGEHALLFGHVMARAGQMTTACQASEARRQAQAMGRTISTVLVDPLSRKSA